MISEQLLFPRQEVQDTVEEKRCTIECESAVELYEEMCVRCCE